MAWILSRSDPQLSREDWRAKLQAVCHGDEEPDLELLTQIDSLLAKPAGKVSPENSDMMLF